MQLKEIEGVQIQNVETGKITGSITSDNTKDGVVNTIEKAGYTVSSDNDNKSSSCTTGCCSK